MNFKIKKYFRFLSKKLIHIFFIRPRIIKYKFFSTCEKITGKPNRIGAVLINGKGKVNFGTNVNLGVIDSPVFFETYTYIEARNNASIINFGNNIYVNNNACFVSEGAEIIIGNDVLIGSNFTVVDSDFHELDPLKRINGVAKMDKVQIMDNVFIGSNVTILKGVTIGQNSVIGSGAVVVKSIPENVIAGGNPCKVLRNL